MAYSEKVLDHYENPRNVGKLDDTDVNVGTGMVGAPACGDVMRLQIRVNDAGIIEEAKFKTYGCGSAIASSSLLTEWVKGRSLDEAKQIKNTDIVEELGLPPVKIHCSVLAEDAIKAAVYRGFSSVIEACAESLAHVQNENELTGSDVVWVELENAQEAVVALKSAMSQK